MMILIDQDRMPPTVRVEAQLSETDLDKLSPKLIQALFSSNTQAVLDALSVAHNALTRQREDTDAAPWD